MVSKDSSSLSPATEIIPATTEDIQTIHTLADEIWHQYYVTIIGADTVEYMLELMYTPEVIRKDMASGLEYFLIKEDSIATGYFGIREEDSELFLSRLYILQTSRGRGNGRQAIEFICDLAKERNMNKVYLTVAKNNTGSIAFYKSCGLSIIDSICKDIGDDFAMNDYVMARDIQS